MGSVAQSLKRLREIINTNVTEPQNTLWVTLTYRENMTDEKRLYQDFRRFHQRLKHYHNKNSLLPYEYIVAAEPQGRGAWHLNLLLIYGGKVPFIPNEMLSKIWRHGFTKTTALKNVGNVGAYLSAYLGDMELMDSMQKGLISENAIIEKIEEMDRQGRKNKKYYIKGARLRLCPKGFRLYRKSKGIRPPTVSEMIYGQALAAISSASLVYEKTIQIEDDNGTVLNTINYKQYTHKGNRHFEDST